MRSSQSSSIVLQISPCVGFTPGRASSQSSPHSSPLQHSFETTSSPSRSRSPNVVGSQSSSTSSSSHVSLANDERDESMSSQSPPPHRVERSPSPSRSGTMHGSSSQT